MHLLLSLSLSVPICVSYLSLLLTLTHTHTHTQFLHPDCQLHRSQSYKLTTEQHKHLSTPIRV